MSEGKDVVSRLEDVRALLAELEPILQSVVLNDSTIIDALAQLLSVLQHMDARASARDARLGELLDKVDKLLAERTAAGEVL